MNKRLTRNAIRCLSCDTVIESTHRHDFVTCPCGMVSVDGGLAYERVLWSDKGKGFEELYEYEAESDLR